MNDVEKLSLLGTKLNNCGVCVCVCGGGGGEGGGGATKKVT